VKCYIWREALCGAETGTLRRVDQKYMESFGMWCWGRTEKSSWTDRVRHKEVLPNVKEQRNVLHKMEIKKAKWIFRMLRRNCFVKHVIEVNIEGWIEVKGR